MNPAEEIVKFWLQQKGYFLQSSVRLPRNKEIDILAINKESGERKHIEVSVSIRMADYKSSPKTKAKEVEERKFNDLTVKNEVEKKLGKTYTKEFVVGDITLQGKNQFAEFFSECEKLGIKVIHISDILDEIIPTLGTGSQLNSTVKAMQIVSKFYHKTT